MKPVLITFFLALLTYSLFFDEEGDVLECGTAQTVSNAVEKKPVATDKPETSYYAKILHNHSDSVFVFSKEKSSSKVRMNYLNK